MDEEKRRGAQEPTTAVILPYEETYGHEAEQLYRQYREPFPWQVLIVNDILAHTEDGLFTHMVFGLTVPRQNGKNEALIMRELWGLKHGERIIHTAHRTDTAHKAWERLAAACEAADIAVTSSYRANGKEHLWVEGGGIIEFRTRTSTGALGSTYDLLVIDEAQEYTETQQSALAYTISASQNPQTIMTGTAPTAVSSGTEFSKLRTRVLAGEAKMSAWEEWGIEEMTDPEDVEAWYATNPSLGYTLSERTISIQASQLDTLDFNIQRLGYWTGFSLKSAISLVEWDRCKCDVPPEVAGPLYIGIKYGKGATSAAMSVAVATTDGNTFVESIDCRDGRLGNDWIVSFLKDTKDVTAAVVVDGSSGQAVLENDLKDANAKIKLIFPRVAEIIHCNSLFEQSIVKKQIRHMGQPSLEASVTNCEHRAIGSGFGFKSIKTGVDISLMESAALAVWARHTIKPKKAHQTVGY